MDFICFIIIGILAGWLAGHIMKGRGWGIIGNLAVGMIGAIFGGFLFRILGLKSIGFIGDLIIATTGAVVLLSLLRAFTRRRR